MKFTAALIPFCLLANICFAAANNTDAPKPPETIAELQKQLEQILTETHTPGMSVAIVRRSGPEWIAGLGKADVASDRAVTPDTLFRIGSTSKAFASLSILKLVSEGKLKLEDQVHQLAPEIWFHNPWEATDPVLVVDLLEHTTGWDDMHLREYAKDAPGMSLREGLDYDHSSRVSRWRPGTRMAYCNSGPPVAAYIVEKISGQRFEDYVAQNFFGPIGMKTATYFQPPADATTLLYRADGVTPYPYWNILLRPAGSINASANDMAAYVGFYLARGSVHGTQILPSPSIDRMEIPTRTWAAQQGLKTGYGLSNYWSLYKGFVLHGHNGGVSGGLTNMAYMADYGVGFYFSINAQHPGAFARISDAIHAYITHDLEKPPVPPAAPMPDNTDLYAGWYEPDSPRNQMVFFIQRLSGLARVAFEDNKMLSSSPFEKTQVAVPLVANQFRYSPETGIPIPVATVALLTPNPEGIFIQFSRGTETRRKIPTWLAFSEFALMAWFAISLVSIALYAPFWLLAGLSKKRRRPAERGIRAWPLLAVLSLSLAVGVTVMSAGDALALMGNLTIWSATLCLATVAFAFTSIAAAVALWRAPREGVRALVRWHAMFVIPPLLIATAYLGYWGVIGIRTWS